MIYLVIGGAGFIGRQLVEQLRESGRRVRVLDCAPQPAELPGDIEYYRGDLGDMDVMRQALDGCEIVYHLAYSVYPKTSNDNPIHDVESNVVGTLRLLDACVTAGIRRIVFSSSGGTVYGLSSTMPISETCPTNPISSYGITKLTIEKYLHLYYVLHGLDYVIIRPANAYGKGQNPDRGQGVIAAFLKRIAQGQAIEIWGDGAVIRDYVHVQDIARAFCMVANHELHHRIFNVGSGNGVSLNELVQLIRAVTGSDIEVNYNGGRPFDVPIMVLDSRRIEQEVGWVPLISLEDGISRTWRYVLDTYRATL